MKTLPILLFSCLLSFAAIAQQPKKGAAKHDSVAYYMSDHSLMAGDQGSANFLRLIIKKGSGVYEIQDYYRDGTPRLVATSFSGEMNFEEGIHGLYTEYYRNGKKRVVRNYYKGKLTGEDSTYYYNGQLYSVVTHSKTGDYLKTCLDTTGKALAANGNGVWVECSEFSLLETYTGPVVNGKKDGTWVQRFAVDTVVYKTEYKNGVELPGPKRKKEDWVFQVADQQPSFSGSDTGFSQYLATNIRYPQYAREQHITGRVILTFVVEKNGSLSELRVLRSPDESLSNEAMRVMKASPAWKPGILNGQPVRVQFSVPIGFALSND